jgi:cell wall assembly regulator SMI1
MESISSLWGAFEQRLYRDDPKKLITLNPPATPAAIQMLERQLSANLPTDFKNSLLVHDGGTFGNELLDGEELLSIPRILEEWRVWESLLKSPGMKMGDVRSSPEPEVRDDWWNVKWIPITSNHAGDHWCLDLDPAPAGTYGQVIRMWHDMDMRELGGKSFSEFFHKRTTP